jgi:hypothetical protein
MAYGTGAPVQKRFAEDYIDVAERLRAWYEEFPNGRVETEIVSSTDSRIVMKAYVYRGAATTPSSDVLIATEAPAGIGHSAMNIPGSTPYTRGSELENCETSAVGRALVMAGLPSKRVASTDEIRAKGGTVAGDKPTVVVAPSTSTADFAKALEGATSMDALAEISGNIQRANLTEEERTFLGNKWKEARSKFASIS